MDKPSFDKHPRPADADGPADAAPALRASDVDRDRVADILREALGEGRITAEEHAERVGAVYAAKTVGELEPLVRDLPAPVAGAAAARPAEAPARPAPASAGAADTDNVVAVFGGASRKGRWRVGRRTNAFTLFGGVEIDLTEAVFEYPEIVINVTAVFGGVEIRVPENVTLRCGGAAVFGGFDVKAQEAPEANAPVVVITGFAFFGGVDAKPRRGKRLKDLRAAG
ncbi:DUF1707 domain-containing protein [Streptomyces gamaensis]|uniref:DUF1707 domain-containing protein n=1 Tax=Streptomyces gamaensis TaxID=1763542 RepID=A0ABW0YQT0_9ACTN